MINHKLFNVNLTLQENTELLASQKLNYVQKIPEDAAVLFLHITRKVHVYEAIVEAHYLVLAN